MIIKWIILGLLCQFVLNKCHNNTEFKYQLKEVSQILGYTNVCYQYTKRTCCSPKNIDVLYRKIGKMISGGVYQLSSQCKQKISQLMCSTCDGDMGQGIKEGICPNYCLSLYEACRNDYFITDANGKLRVCKAEDFVCSQLKYIIPNPEKGNICEQFGGVTKIHSCWNGENSADYKPKGKKKIKYQYKRVIPGRQQQDGNMFQNAQKTYVVVALGIVLGGLVLWKWGMNKLKNRKYYHKLR